MKGRVMEKEDETKREILQPLVPKWQKPVMDLIEFVVRGNNW